MYACGRRDGGNEGEQRTRSVRTRGHKRPRRAHHGDPGNRTQHHGRGTLALFSARPRPLAPQFLGVLVTATSHFNPYVFLSSRKRCCLLKGCARNEHAYTRPPGSITFACCKNLHVLRTGRVLTRVVGAEIVRTKRHNLWVTHHMKCFLALNNRSTTEAQFNGASDEPKRYGNLPN